MEGEGPAARATGVRLANGRMFLKLCLVAYEGMRVCR